MYRNRDYRSTCSLLVVCCSLLGRDSFVVFLSSQGAGVRHTSPRGAGVQPTTNNQPPTTNHQQSTNNNQQPTKKGRVSLATLPTIRVHLHITIYHFWGEGSNHLYKDFLKISQSQETRFLLAYPRLTLRKGDCLSLGFWSP